MKQLISLGILALLSLPWDAQAETSAASRTPLSPATMATVHGQSADSASLPEESAQKTPAPSGSDLKKAQEAQALFEKYRKRSDQRERALLPVSPDLRTRTVRVTLEPGRAPVKVFTTANIATSLVFHDSTGQPWPITSVTNGGPSSFQVLRPELPEGNLLNVMPIQGYATSTLVVTLENRDIPLVIRLESDSVRAPERKADALVLIQLAHHGPKAAIPLTSTIKETASSAMLSFLDRVPPDDAVRLRSEPDSDAVMAWKYNGKHYVRTTHSLMWPAWTAVVNGAGSTKCYELPVTTRIMLSREGSVQTILLKNTLK